MASFQLTRQAKSDLKSIAAFTQRQWGKAQRRLYLKHFHDAFHLIAEKPQIGTACDYIKAGYRKFPVTSHVVYYRAISDSTIEIVRVLHKQMDVKFQLDKA